MRPIFTIMTALVAGFVGGILGTRVPNNGDQGPKKVVRARSFELVNEAGQVISYWGTDKGGNLVLTFGSRGAFEGSALHYRPIVDLKDMDNQLTAIGLQGNDMPLLKMRGDDRKTRVRLYLSQDSKPILLMEDQTGPRVSLGIDQSDTPGPDDNNWTLDFLPERASIGMVTEKEGGQKYVRGFFSINKDKVKYPYQQPK
jgi:hypothetical protein